MDYKTLDSLNFGQTYFILFPYINESKEPILEQQPASIYANQFGGLELGCLDPLHIDRIMVLADDTGRLKQQDSVNDYEVYYVENFIKYYQKGSKGYSLANDALASTQSF